MADNVSIKTIGMADLDKSLQRLAQSLAPDQVEKAAYNSANIITEEIRRRAPQGPTGRLKESPHTKTLRREGDQPAPAIAAIDRAHAPHAWLVEFGTRYADPHPFFRPAVDDKAGPAADNFEAALRRLIEGAI